MKLKELLNNGLVIEIDENRIKCLSCGKICTKIGIPRHYYYKHDSEGMESLEELRKIATENNNDPEMKRKIGERTKEELNKPGPKQKLLDFLNDPETKEEMSRRNKELWKDPVFREKTINGIRNSRTEEFKAMMSQLVSEAHNREDSTVKSGEFRELMSKLVKERWEDPDYYDRLCESLVESWNDPERRKNQSEIAKELWEDPEHIKKVLEGKLRSARENGSKSFGKIGKTDGGHIYESNIEKEVFKLLENKNIDFETHEQIPRSRKICDLVINNIWIELDGMGRDSANHPQHEELEEKILHYRYLKNRNIILDFKIFNGFNQFLNWFYGEYSKLCQKK